MGIFVVVMIFASVAALIALSIYHFNKRRGAAYASSRQRYLVLFAASFVVAILILVLILWQFT
jgi:hypothetical protein